MKPVVATFASSLAAIMLLASSAIFAADTHSGPTANQRLTTARKAIEAKDWSRAQSELNTAVRAEPRNADIHNLLGYIARKQAMPDLPKAFEHYKIALQLDPRHKGAHEYIGEAYLMAKQPEEAQQHLAELEKICGNKTCEEYEDLAKSIATYKVQKP